ncbi:MAG TPA: outer membrane beta-barrel protein [Pyrinomonadaceae bacterium]|nr:outer membrane beta-barrel protein [Pyrinomonadaceae bacterium]
MRRLFLAALFAAICAPTAFAQTDDYNKADFFVGYSHNRVDTGIGDDDPDFDDIFEEREGFNGFNVSAKGNVSRYVGIKGDYSFHRKRLSETVAGTTFDVDFDLHTVVGGVEFKDNARETRVKPFAHLMAGIGHARVNLDGPPAFDDTQSETGLAGVIGGGLDFRISPRVDFRAIQFDYNPTRIEGQTAHNFRIGIGFVFR